MPEQADRFVKLATRTFRMSDQLAPGVTVQDYEDMRNLSQVAADIVAFPNPHINHLTPRALDIQDVYDRMYEEGKEKNFAMLKQVQGPPTAMDPTVLLNQTSYVSKPTWVYTDIDQKHWLEDANTLASLASAVQAAELDGKPITLEYDASKPDLAKFGLALDNAGLNLELLFGDNNRAQITLQEVVDAIAANERISGFAFSEPVPEVDIIAHTARFGEIEQRGIALTREGRAVYDEALKEAAADYNKASAVWKLKEKGTELFKESIANMNDLFQAVATQPFRASGLWKDAQQIDPYAHLIEQKLAHFTYEVAAPEKLDNAISDKLMSQLEAGNGIYLPEAMQPLVDAGVVVRKPMVYEDFLPKSAAGIFKGNQAQASDELSSADIVVAVQDEKLKRFIDAGVEPYIAYNLYAAQEAQSVQRVLAELKEEQAVDVPQAVDAMLEQRIRGRNMRLAYEESAALETKHDEANLGFKRSA